MKERMWKLAETIITVILTSGITSAIVSSVISKNIQKEISSYQLKLEKYSLLGEELAKVASNDFDPKKLDHLLNGTLVFGSDDVILSVQDFMKRVRENKLAIKADGSSIISRDELLPIFRAIRTDLNESSNFNDDDIWFSQMGSPQCL